MCEKETENSSVKVECERQREDPCVFVSTRLIPDRLPLSLGFGDKTVVVSNCYQRFKPTIGDETS